MRKQFVLFGLPKEVVSDNGPQFTSAEFERFLKKNDIKFTRTPVYHTKSNGLAERAVQTIKMSLNKSAQDGNISFRHRIASSYSPTVAP